MTHHVHPAGCDQSRFLREFTGTLKSADTARNKFFHPDDGEEPL